MIKKKPSNAAAKTKGVVRVRVDVSGVGVGIDDDACPDVSVVVVMSLTVPADVRDRQADVIRGVAQPPLVCSALAH
jgi:hypothetical protein